MILPALVLIPLVGGTLAWFAGRRRPVAARWVALVTVLVDLALALTLFGRVDAPVRTGPVGGPWIAHAQWDWIPQIGASLQFGIDGLSLWLVVLTLVLGALGVLVSWREIEERVGLFHFHLTATLAGIVGVFVALDLLLFYVFWELMLIPMVFLIGLWGHERRIAAAVKFFLFTQAGGLLLLVSILSLVQAHVATGAARSFDLFALVGTPLGAAEVWIALGFVVAFAVKLPVVPLHTWLPDAHTEAPTAGSLVLAGLLLKTGAYGMLRFVLPLFPGAVETLAPALMTLGVVGILYGAVLAFGQTDLKRLVAYTSVSHLGFVLLGIFSGDVWGLRGAVLQMICHGLSTGALFAVVGQLQERLHTRAIDRVAGLQARAPRLAGWSLLFVMASLGLPGLGNFVAEFLVLAGSFRSSVVLTAIAVSGLVMATLYSLRVLQRVFHGPESLPAPVADLDARELTVLAVMAVGLVWLGLYPMPVLEGVAPFLDGLVR